MNIVKLFLAIGVGLIVGGPLFIWVNGYEVLNLTFWLTSLGILVTDPGAILSASLPGSMSANTELFQGILMVGLGVMVLSFTFGASWLLSLKKGKGSKGGTVIKMDEFDEVVASESSEKPAKPSVASMIKDKMEKSKKAVKEDSVTDFSDEEISNKVSAKNAKSIGSLLGMLKKKGSPTSDQKDDWNSVVSIATNDVLNNKPAAQIQVPEKKSTSKRINKKTATMRITTNPLLLKWEGFRAKLDTLWDNSVQRKGKETTQDNMGTSKSSSVKKIEGSEIALWYKNVREGAMSTSELVSRAKEILNMLDEKSREDFVETNPMDGTFIIRLLESWAARTDFSDSIDEEDNPRAMIRKAVRAIHKADDVMDIPEEALPKDLQEEIELENYEQNNDDEDIFDDVRSETASSADAQKDNDEDGNQEDDIRLKFEDIASQMRFLIHLAKMVNDGQEEWPETLTTEEERMEEAGQLDEALARLTFIYDEQEVYDILESSDSESLLWLLENKEIISQGFTSFAKQILLDRDEEEEDATDSSPMETPSQDSEEVAEETDAETDSGWSDDDLSNDDIEDQKDESDIDEQGRESNTGTEQSDDEDDVDSLNSALAEIARLRDQLDEEASNDTSSDDVSDTTDTIASEEQLDSQYANVTEQPDAVMSVDDTEKPEDKTAPLVVEPADISLIDMDEIKFASRELMEWSAVSKQASASAGTMMRLIYDKTDDAILPVGMVHIMMVWKNKPAKPNQVHIIFRYLQEGNWSIEENGLKAVKENGDFVTVNEKLIEHDMLNGDIVIVHYTGPGASSVLQDGKVRISDRSWAINGTLDKDSLLELFDLTEKG